MAQSPGAIATPGASATAGATPTATATATASAGPSAAAAVLVGAGDIADCTNVGASAATAALIDAIPGTVFTAGDDAYQNGSPQEFQRCYDPTWGAFRGRTRPALGNHEYGTAGAAGYFGYFGKAAGPAGLGYYAYDLGAWRIYVLNSECPDEISCAPDSPQVTWLRADLAAHPATCVAAIWHHPRWSSGPHGSDARTAPFWDVLYQAGAEIVIDGHDHDYERFAPQRPDGTRDDATGIREFVVGTGGATRYPTIRLTANSEVRSSTTWGVLKLTLEADGYAWQFLPVAGGSFTDQGQGTCH